MDVVKLRAKKWRESIVIDLDVMNGPPLFSWDASSYDSFPRSQLPNADAHTA
jgi:hypothetical protein